jgi:hypothetical protein
VKWKRSPKPLELAVRMASSVSTNWISKKGRTFVISVCDEGGNRYIVQLFYFVLLSPGYVSDHCRRTS